MVHFWAAFNMVSRCGPVFFTLLLDAFTMTAGKFFDFKYMIWSSIRDTKGVTTRVKPETHMSQWVCEYTQNKQSPQELWTVYISACVCVYISVCTLGAESRQLVAETFSSSCGNNQEEVFVWQGQIDGPQLQLSELGEAEWALQALIHFFRPWKVCRDKE